jgi:hypothetical protein
MAHPSLNVRAPRGAETKGNKTIMKAKWLGLGGTLCILATTTVLAADDAVVRYDSDRTVVAERNINRNWVGYEANELSFGIFGTGTVGEDTLDDPNVERIERDGELGVGGSISYFFHRHVGIEGYAYTESTGDSFIDNVGGDLIVRFPLGGSGVALYGLGGGARQFDPVIQWTLDAGGGIEWRFLPHAGIFVDARYVWADKTKDYGLGRLGMKFGF